MIRTITAAVFIAALALLSTACTDDEKSPHPASTSNTVSSTQPAPADTEPAQSDPSAGIRTKPGAAPQVTSPNSDSPAVPCEGTICTNPNHGAGSNPQENGGAVIQNPQGGTGTVPCEGTICTNPNHGAGN